MLITAQGQRTRKRVITIPKLKSLGFVRPQAPRGRNSGFTPQIRRQGKFISLGNGLEFDDAFNLATNRTRSTLAASFRVLDSRGQPVKTKSPFGFAPSKREPLVQIQGKRKIGGVGSRLGTRSEIVEIKSSRRSNPFFRAQKK